MQPTSLPTSTTTREICQSSKILETNSLDEATEMHGAVRDITRSAYRACNLEAEKHHKTLHDTSVILDIVGPALANAMPPSAFVNFRGSHAVTVLRTLVCGDRTFIGDHITEIAEIGSHARRREQWRSVWVALLVDAADNEHAFVSRITSKKNLGDDDTHTEDDETSIDFKEYTCVEKIWRQWSDNAETSILECRQTGERFSRHTQI